MPTTCTRRVSFSERVSYSDDASTTTVTTDDELFRDDGSFLSSDDEDDDVPDSKEEVETEVDAMCIDEELKPEESEDTGSQNDGDVGAEDAKESPKLGYAPVKDEPPLVFRDVGITERPSDYLGGYGPESMYGSPHRVKLRNSWVENASPEDEEESEYKEFEEWKRARAKAAAEKKQARDVPATKKPSQKKEQVEAEDGDSPEVEPEQESTDKIGRQHEGVDESKGEEPLLNPKQERSPVPAKASTPESTKPKSALKQSKTLAHSIHQNEFKGPEKQTMSPVQPKTPKAKQPKVRDPESEAHEKEILELNDKIAHLQRQLELSEVRTISQLADLEEESAQRMREYRAKADEIVRKQRAKNEKRALKQKAMRSQDVIEQLRKSNQKLRAEGTKMQAAISKLRENNQSLEEKNSVHRGYSAEFLSFQKVEVSIAEAMNEALKHDVPKYENLIRCMEDGAEDRVKSGHIESNAKELYEDCIHSMMDMLETNCSDATLMEKVASLMDDSADDDASVQPDTSYRSFLTEKRKSLDRKVESSKGEAAMKNSSIRRTSRSSLVKEDPRSSQHKKGVRRSQSSTGKISKGTTKEKRSSTSDGSFRGTRSVRKSSINKMLSDGSSDDSSTCSLTSMPSVTSENFSISDYAY